MDFGDGMLDDLNNFDLDDIQFSPCYPLSDSEKDSFPQKEKELSADESRKGLIQTTDQALSQIELASEPSMFPVHTERETFSEIKKTAETTVVESNIMDSWGSQIMDGESVCLHLPETEATDNFDNLLQIAANDPDPPMQVVHSDLKTVDPTHVYFAQNTMHHHPDVKVENSNPTLVSASARPSRQRRKSVQTSRNCQDSPLTFHMDNEETIDLQALGRSVVKTEHTKPFALAALNGTDSRSRDRSTSVASTSDIGSPGSVKPRTSKSGEGKRKRKYEFEDDNDPSVKNAKAAKMNRDKKKQMMQELQQKVGHLTTENENLTEQRDRIQSQYDQLERQRAQEIYQLQQRLQAEISKNAANSKQKVKMLDLIKDVVGVVNPPPQVICVSDRLASTPMPDSSELEGIRNMQNIPQSGMNTYLTFKEPHID